MLLAERKGPKDTLGLTISSVGKETGLFFHLHSSDLTVFYLELSKAKCSLAGASMVHVAWPTGETQYSKGHNNCGKACGSAERSSEVWFGAPGKVPIRQTGKKEKSFLSLSLPKLYAGFPVCRTVICKPNSYKKVWKLQFVLQTSGHGILKALLGAGDSK